MLLLGFFYPGDVTELAAADAVTFENTVALGFGYLHAIPEYMYEVTIALAPIIVFFLIFNALSLKLSKNTFRQILVGLVYTFAGLVLFLTGVNVGFSSLGVMLAVPLKSVGGGRTLTYLTDNAVPDGSVPKMEFNHELIVIILNQNYVDDVMDVARSAGAPGGTVIHAKGTGAQYAKKFFGVSLAEEKEIVLIAAKTDKKTAIMKAVAENVGVGTPAGAIAFSLPISDVAGLREFDCEEKKKKSKIEDKMKSHTVQPNRV